ncbi:MAG TPA: glucose 1-dehydrogenase [Candidatus Acidoferrales bacterium]|nr:glucose 1-dehydrogenase [Candidatus Acidoferrales bacterium]
MLLIDRIAIITGGGRGIGRAIARRFAAAGAKVAVVARTQKEIETVAGELRSAGYSAVAISADVSQESGAQKIVAETLKHFGRIDILVNNAGVLGSVKAIEEVDPAEWDAVIAANLRGPFLLSRLVLPEMYHQKSGAIINMSSVAGKAAFRWNAPYAASKTGLLGLTRTLAAEAAANGVRVNAICPGPVEETEMLQKLGKGLSERLQTSSEKVSQQLALGILQGRAQRVEEIAAAALFLASDAASAITGQTLNVDGGMSFY